MLVLGIETSCDDTAAAVVAGGSRVLSSVVHTQLEHREYGGVVPEIAARRHIELLPLVVARALEQAAVTADDIEAVAVTRGPGLIGALLCGWCYGKAWAGARGLPYVGVHHLAAHIHAALMPLLADGAAPEIGLPDPLLALVVSGGHTALHEVWTDASPKYRLLGQTRDDAVGEAFDKVAKMLGLGYPGGPAIDALAERGDPTAFALPRPRLGVEFSFSGLKTAVRRLAIERGCLVEAPRVPRKSRRGRQAGPTDRSETSLEAAPAVDPEPVGARSDQACASGQTHPGQVIADLAASFQAAAVESLVETTAYALDSYRGRHDGGQDGVEGSSPRGLVLAGGVAANSLLRRRMQHLATDRGLPLMRSSPELSTDNAAMIAGQGHARLSRGESDSRDAEARASWPL